MAVRVHRRRFLKAAGVSGGGLAIGLNLPGCGSPPARRFPGQLVPNASLRITPDDRVIFTLARVEMGQGTMTSQAMIVAEELDLRPADIEVVFAPNHSDFAEPELGVQVTGGSTSTKNGYPILQKAGAMAREALFQAAAEALAVRPYELALVDGTVAHAASGRSKTFGELATRAQTHLSEDARPKPRAAWRVVGRDHVRLDARSKVDGTAKYGADHSPPGLETAVLIRGPLGATVLGVEADEARAVTGVRAVERTPYGVAVIADRYHQARKAADRVRVRWSPSGFSTDAMWGRYSAALDGANGLANARADGDVARALTTNEAPIEAEYRLPFLAHTTMEPQTCTAWVRGNECEIWAPTQAPMQVALSAAEATGISAERVTVHQTFLGCGFGRRSEADYAAEAAHLSKLRGGPVRVQWSREDDIQHDFYRPASLHRLRGAVANGWPVAWEHRIVQQSALARPVRSFLRERMPGLLAGATVWAMTRFTDDLSIVEGAAQLPYRIPHVAVGYQTAEEPVPVGFWRSVAHSSNGFVVESFIDELAHAAERDPVDFRRDLLADHPSHLAVLERATREARWGSAPAGGRARGVAVHESFGTCVAVVAEVSVDDGHIRVHELTAAVDCGLVIHPDGVRAQIEGGMIFALGPALTDCEITFEDGRVQQSNFHDYQTLRFDEAPEIVVHLVETDRPPSGVGEPGVPPTAAAVANAVFALTGRRLRSLPLRLG